MDEETINLLKENGWIVVCHSPFEIEYEDGGAFASGYAAQIILDSCRYERNNGFSEQDMHDCFNAGVNRGVTIAAMITRHDIGEEFPDYKTYVKKYDE